MSRQRGVSAAAITPPVVRPAANYRWVVVFLAFVIAAVSYLDRNNLSIAAGAIKSEFELSDVQLGAVFSAFVFGYALVQPFAGRMADKLGAYRAVAIAIVWWGAFTTLTALVPSGLEHSLAILIGVRFLLGIGEAVIFPATNRLVSSWIPSRERGLANGVIFAGVGIGGGVAPPLVTFIMLTFGWRWAFYASALIGFAVGAFWLVLVRDRPQNHPSVGAEEQAYIEVGVGPMEPATPEGARWWRAILDRQVALLTLSYFCYGYVAYIFFSWFFVYLSTVRGLNLKTSALYAMLPFVAMTVFSTLGGLISDRLVVAYGKRIGRCGVAMAGMLLASVFVALATQVADPRLASIVLAGGAGALYLAQSAYWALSADIGKESAGVVSGVMNMGAQIGGVVTASATAVVAHRFGWTASFLAAALVCLVGALCWLRVDPHHQLRAAADPASP